MTVGGMYLRTVWHGVWITVSWSEPTRARSPSSIGCVQHHTSSCTPPRDGTAGRLATRAVGAQTDDSNSDARLEDAQFEAGLDSLQVELQLHAANAELSELQDAYQLVCEELLQQRSATTEATAHCQRLQREMHAMDGVSHS